MSLDCSKMKYDISEIPKDRYVVDKFPELSEYKEFSDKKDDLLLRIAFFSTDEQSPFLKKYRDDYEKRILGVFDYLKIDDQDLLNEILINRNESYSSIVNRFFVLCDNLAYVMWSNMLFNFHMSSVALRRTPDEDKMTEEMDKRAKLQQQQKKIHEDLVAYEAIIFPDTTTRKIIRQEAAKILQLPEKYAKEKGRF